MGPPQRSRPLGEAVKAVGSVLLIAAWTLVTFYPEGGLNGAEATALRGGVALAAALLLVVVVSVPLKASGLLRWSPPLDLYLRVRESRRRRAEALARERQLRREAPYRAIQSLDAG